MGSHGLRVMLVGINFAPEETGIAPYSSGLARGLRDRGHEVSVVTTFPHYPQWRIAEGYGGWQRRERCDGVEVTRLLHYVPRRPVGMARACSELTFGARATARPWGDPDVVLCVSPALLSTAMTVGRATCGTRRPRVGLVVQDLYSAGVEEQGGPSRVAATFARIESWVARQVDGVAVIHDRFRDRVVDSLGVSPDRVSVIRNWTHLPEAGHVDREAMRRALGWRNETVVLHSGAMGQKQDLANVVDTARLAAQRGERVRFVLMGDGVQRSMLEDLGRGVPTLQFVDPLPGANYGKVLRSADVLLVNEKVGLKEMAVPSKLTSYFSTGLPVLAATNADSTTADEIRASGAGIVVDPGDPKALLAGVNELSGDRDRALAIGARGPIYCGRVLSEAAAIDAYDTWVRELHARRHRDHVSTKGSS